MAAGWVADNMDNLDVLALGEALIEFVRMKNEPTDSTRGEGQTTPSRPYYQQGFGGDTSNALIATTRQCATPGLRTGYITAVGNDPLGQELLKLWQEEGISIEHVEVAQTDPTGVYFVQPEAGAAMGKQFSYARRGSAASHYSTGQLPLDAIAKAKLLHTSALSCAISQSMSDAVQSACEHARAHNTLVSFDTNLRLNLWTLESAIATIEKLLPHIDIVFPSDDEAQQICGRTDRDAMIDYFLDFGCSMVVLTCGADGAIIANGSERFTVAAADSKPVDSTAAGDSFAGAFLAHYLDTDDIHYAGRCAAITAALTVSSFGAIDAIPHRDDVLQRLN